MGLRAGPNRVPHRLEPVGRHHAPDRNVAGVADREVELPPGLDIVGAEPAQDPADFQAALRRRRTTAGLPQQDKRVVTLYAGCVTVRCPRDLRDR